MKGRFFDGYGKPAWVPLAVAAIIQWRAALAGLEGDFAGHSLRSGFVTEGGRQGIALPALMTMTEHRSVASDVGYFQTGSASTNPAAHLLTRAGARVPRFRCGRESMVYGSAPSERPSLSLVTAAVANRTSRSPLWQPEN